MKSLNIFSPVRGFTLFEVVIVIALFSVLFATGLFFSIDTYRSVLQRDSHAAVINVLTLARGRALANLNGTSHGVCLSPPNIVLFRGGAYASASKENELYFVGTSAAIVSPNNSFSCESGVGIIFTAITATTSHSSIFVGAPGRPGATIIVNEEGAIL